MFFCGDRSLLEKINVANKKSYVVISPCRDEEEYMRQTLDSMLQQTLLPTLWVIVDDGSTDGTPEILKTYQQQHSFIKIVTRKNRGFRKVGPGVVDTFYEGYRAINPDQYEYLCKLDLDLILPPKYFEVLIDKMAADPRIGTCSGKPYNEIDGKFVSEKRGDEMSVGMTKLYRMSCFKQIGGLVREVMWDAIDSHRCRQLGWIACSWDEPELRFTHLRLMGSSQQSIYVGRMRHGFGQYFMGTGALYMAATSVFRMRQTPYILGGLAMFWGYIKALFSGAAQLDDVELRQFIRLYQWQCLIKGKAAATAQVNQEQSASWDVERNGLPMPVNDEVEGNK
jgi:hypothetical protein